MRMSPNEDETAVHGCQLRDITRVPYACAEPYHPGSGYRGAGTCATVLKLELFDFTLDIDENVVRRDSLIRV